MKISSVILNWNRAALLDRTISSYLATVEAPYQLAIVDNASTDHSREVIAAWQARVPELRSILLDANLGGEAINLAFDGFDGELVHISENDQLFLPGWCQHAREVFRLFPDLGQLSLFGLSSTDEGGWYDNSGKLRHSDGKILYEVIGNVTTSCILRGTLIHDYKLRIHNIDDCPGIIFKFPADGDISDDVRRAGYWCAWSDRYYARNLGHELAEYDRDPTYYEQNHAAKPWIGVDRWRHFVDAMRVQPFPNRRSVALPAALVQPEASGGTPARPAQLWSMLDTATAQVEVLDFLYALVRLVKPLNAFETGTWFGASAIAIATAMRENGIGHLWSIEADADIASIAGRNIGGAGIDSRVTQVVADSREWMPPGTYQFAFFDTDPGLAAVEFMRFYDRLDAGAVAVFDDAAGDAAAAIGVLVGRGLLQGTFFKTPRSLFVGTVCRPAEAAS